MAGEEQAKSDFEGVLSRIDRKFDLIAIKWLENKNFEIRFRTQIQRNSDDFNALCDEWVDLFSEVTKTVWVKKVSNTGPKIKFRKQYQCWTYVEKEVQKELLFDARRCRGTLDVKVLTDNPLTRRKNRHIKLGLNVVVKINFNHLHEVDTSRPFAFFVHTCEPLAEVPKPTVQPNNNISQKVAEIIKRRLNVSSKEVNGESSKNNEHIPQQSNSSVVAPSTISNIEEKAFPENHRLSTDNTIPAICTQVLPNLEDMPSCFNQNYLPVFNLDQVQLNPLIQFNGTNDSIKLEIQPQIQQLSQVSLCTPQLGMSEPIMCQPTLMLDSQILSFTAHHLVQMHSHNLQNQTSYYI
ncbi:uncharacterized protein LOC108736580 [Agrilus planipennis]|uniref:Uncharacterized protein LOC108736580 n=1 Tax=Agrilus planipennis TaxID=224129 RepID=A0A1W4WKW9_AGRPL|nr:uncharacterized protein LOC108736580 [Agrilus planipennis]